MTPQTHHSDTSKTEERITLRVPMVLAAKMKSQVEEKKCKIRKYSQNDWIVEAIRMALDGNGDGVNETPARHHGDTTVAPQERIGEGVDRGGDPWEVKREWLAEWRKLRAMSEYDPGSYQEEMMRLAPGFRAPKGWDKVGIEEQAKWLDEKYPLVGE